MQKIEWKNEKRKIAELIPADYNPRTLLPKEREDLEQSIKTFSEVEPVIVNIGKRANVIIGGHQRVKIYADLGITEIDVRVPSRELTVGEETELNLRLNKNTGSWDWEKLKEFDIDQLLQVGFGDEELSDLWDDIGTFDDNWQPSEKLKEAKNTTVKLGEIYQLGAHRLMCGDSTNMDDVKKLMNGKLADMIYCDPPYNIGLDYDKGMSAAYTSGKATDHKGGFPDMHYGGTHSKKDDSKTNEDYSTFLKKTIDCALAVCNKNVHFFYWCDQNFIWAVQQAYKEAGITARRVCLWIKNGMNLTPQFAFNKLHEPCIYGTIGTPYLNKQITKMHEILNREVETGNRVYEEIMGYFDLWLVARDIDYLHPTQKPVTLHEKPIKRCTAPGHIIVDLFGGSGSTLIACEQTKRINYSMEKDPMFMQVIINRWQDLTGEKAKLI